MKIAGFHLLTQDINGYSHHQQAFNACASGARWVQLRCKKFDYDTWLTTAKEVKRICDDFGAVLIINDNVQIALEVKASGVHVGKEDSSIEDARKILGDDFIIGYSCNTFADITNAVKAGANYVGLGPYRYTASRDKLNPLLGLEGVKHVMRDYHIQQMNIPVIVIGGVTKEDVPALAQAGVYGVAVSSAVHTAGNREVEIRSFLTETEKLNTRLTNV